MFEGPFKAVYVENDGQAKYLFSYIHLNPVKLIQSKWKDNGIKNTKRALSFLKNYKWSSYLDYKGEKRLQGKIITPEDFPIDFQNAKDFDREILDWLEYNEDN